MAAKKKKKAFGGYAINFAGQKATLEEVFGKAALVPSQMTKKLWAFIKGKKLGKKG
ncbi:MAG: hypothetical protein HYY37_00105 [Candidatus Aenigmarchaeota archaeon]|nr:hypothetical protein [Candidatus Aenigmarchaeota archaeon]